MVRVSSNNDNLTAIIRVAAFIAMVVCAIVLILDIANVKKYEKVDATVVSTIISRHHRGENGSKSEKIRYIECTYTYNNKEYTITFRTIFKRYKDGTDISLYVNPEAPSEIKNPFVTEINIMILVILIIFTVGMYFCKKK